MNLFSPYNYKIYGEIDPDKEYYIVYSTSAYNYQNWQSELLEFSIKDKHRCQIIKLLAYDSAAKDENFLLGSDVTFVFPNSVDRFNNIFYAPINKPYSFIALTQYWLYIAKLNPEAIMIHLDPDMIQVSSIDPSIFPPVGSSSGHLWYEENIMFPLIIRVCDLYKMSNLYLEYSLSLYDKHGYHCEMYGFTKAIKEINIKQVIINNFGPNYKHPNGNYDNAVFFHYCQSFKKDSKIFWYKQDYTSNTNTKPWKRPYNWQLCKDTLYKKVLHEIHKLIDYQESNEYIIPRTIKRPYNTKL